LSAEVDQVEAQSIHRLFLQDPDMALPRHPRIIPELLVSTIDPDGLMFVGTERAQVFRGRSARGLLRILPLLDGQRDLQAIARELPEVGLLKLQSIASLLYSRGLLEDGVPSDDSTDVFSNVRSFLGRVCDVSRSNRNRGVAFARLQDAAVGIVARTEFAQLLREQFLASGVGSVNIDTDLDSHTTDSYDLLVFVVTGGRAEILERVNHAMSRGQRCLLVCLGDTQAFLGPLFVPGVTSCGDCFLRAHSLPSGEPGRDLAEYWLSIASLQSVHVLSQTAPGKTHMGLRVLRVDSQQEMVQEARLSPRVPGCERCGLPGETYAVDDVRMLAWIYHVGTTIPSRDLVSPKDHQSHYVAANMKLASTEKRALFPTRCLPLPPASPLNGPVPWAEQPVESARVDLPSLATLLAYTAGEVEEHGQRRRIAPTGGNLGSVDLWIIALTVDGLARDIYHYDAPRHTLERVAAVSDSALESCLGGGEDLPDCIIIGTGDLGKCARKYNAFAYRLIHFDSGVAIAYASTLARYFGLGLLEHSTNSISELRELIQLPNKWEFPIPTFALKLGFASLPAGSKQVPANLIAHTGTERLTSEDYSFDVLDRLLELADPAPQVRATLHPPPISYRSFPHNRAPLEEVLLTRRAIRHYAPVAVDGLALREILEHSACFVGWRGAHGAPPCFVRPVLAVALPSDGLATGIYELDGLDGPLVRRSDFGPAQMRECVNQESLAAAPAAIFAIGNLAAALDEGGLRGYRDTAQHAGALIGAAWLAATGRGLVGSAAGGVIPNGFRQHAGMDGFHECPLLGLHLGYPRESRDRP